DGPGVAAANELEAVGDPVPCKRARELRVLLVERVGRAGVRPDVGAAVAQPRRDPRQGRERAVGVEEREIAAEDALQVVRALVAGPALEHPELTGVMKADVERAVPAFGETRQGAPAPARNRPEAGIHGSDQVARDERLPALAAADAVRPLLVGERPGRAERHHEDERANAVAVEEDVLDDAETDGLQE